MRHRRSKRVNLNRGRRTALFRSLLVGLFTHGTVSASEARARQVQVMAEKLITLAREDTVVNRRRILSVIQDRALVKKIVEETAPRYHDRNGGYTQLLKLPPRKGDGCPLSVLTLVS